MEHGLETKEIWGQMHERLLSYIRGHVATVHDAEDVLQEVVVRTHANLHRLKDTQNVTAWIYRIARNAITDYHRQRAKAAGAMQKLAEHIAEAGGSAGNGEPGAYALGEAGADFARCLEPLLNELPDKYRQAIRLTELNGVSQKDAARELGISVSGVKARVQRGRRKLKDVVLDCCSVELDRRGGLIDYERRDKGACDDCDCD